MSSLTIFQIKYKIAIFFPISIISYTARTKNMHPSAIIFYQLYHIISFPNKNKKPEIGTDKNIK